MDNASVDTNGLANTNIKNSMVHITNTDADNTNTNKTNTHDNTNTSTHTQTTVDTSALGIAHDNGNNICQ